VNGHDELGFIHRNTQSGERNMATTLIQAQQKYIDRVNGCHPGHQRRVARAAWSELFKWAESRGMDARPVCQDAKDMARLEQECDE
jgi:hypothetical protein